MITLLLAAALLQAPAPTPKPAEPELSSLEKQGLISILKEYQQVMQELSSANIDIAKAHPGYHLDPQNPFNGKLVKDMPKKDAPAPEKTTEKK